MKRIVLAALVVALVPLGSAAVATTSASVEPTVYVEAVNPQPAEPGNTVKVHVTVENDGSAAGTFDPLTVRTADGVSVIGTTDSIGEQFSLCSGCRRVGTISLKVDGDAVSGTYPIDIVMESRGSGVVEKTEIEVDGTPNLVVTTPSIKAVPGENVTTTLSVRNIGTDTATQTVIEMDEASVSMTPSSLEVGRVPPGETVERDVTFAVDKDLSDGIVHLDLETDYRDESEEKTADTTVPLDVLERADVVLSDVSTDGATIGSPQSMTVKVENLGPGEAKRIAAELSCGDTATVRSGRAFVGQLDDEENVPLTFTVEPEQRQVECEVGVEYRDAEQRSLTETFTFAADRQGVSPALIGLAVLAVVAAFLYRRRTRRQDELAEV